MYVMHWLKYIKINIFLFLQPFLDVYFGVKQGALKFKK